MVYIYIYIYCKLWLLIDFPQKFEEALNKKRYSVPVVLVQWGKQWYASHLMMSVSIKTYFLQCSCFITSKHTIVLRTAFCALKLYTSPTKLIHVLHVILWTNNCRFPKCHLRTRFLWRWNYVFKNVNVQLQMANRMFSVKVARSVYHMK